MERRVLVRAVALLGSWAVGLLVAAWVVPGVTVTVPGFLVAVVVFSVGQALTSLVILKLPREYASLLLGGAGLVLTVLAMAVGAGLTHGLSIDGFASWLAATLVVWLVTTIGAICLPDTLPRKRARAA
jgi:hypothetical protein